MAEKEITDYNPDEIEKSTDLEPDHGTTDDIRPEDSVSNVSAPTYATSVASSVKLRRAAMRLQRLEEETELADIEMKIKKERFERLAIARRQKEALEDALEEEKRQMAMEERRRKAEREMQKKLRLLEEDHERRKLEEEQQQAFLEAERRRIEAERDLRDAEQSTWVSSRSSKSGSKSRSGSGISIRRPQKQSTPVTTQPTFYATTPDRSDTFDKSEVTSSKDEAKTELSLPPSYTTTDPRDASFSLSYFENRRETKTMAGNTAEADDGEGATGDEETAAHRAEEAAKQAEYALEMARQERAEIAKERKAFEVMQRTANQTVQQFAKAAADTAKPQLDLLADQTRHLSTAMKSMNLLSTQNSLMVTKISKVHWKSSRL